MECSLSLAVDLVNTENPVSGNDELTDLAGLTRFVGEHRLAGVKATKRDLEAVRELRADLRRVFDASDQSRAVAILNQLLAASGARPVLTNHDGPWHLHYAPSSSPLAPRIAAEAAMALSVLIATSGFERLRTCEGDRCVDVFVDESRNRSRRYCSPTVCGNRASVAAYRARQRSGEPAAG